MLRSVCLQPHIVGTDRVVGGEGAQGGEEAVEGAGVLGVVEEDVDDGARLEAHGDGAARAGVGVRGVDGLGDDLRGVVVDAEEELARARGRRADSAERDVVERVADELHGAARRAEVRARRHDRRAHIDGAHVAHGRVAHCGGMRKEGVEKRKSISHRTEGGEKENEEKKGNAGGMQGGLGRKQSEGGA